MGFISGLFAGKRAFVAELVVIGKEEGFLSTRAGGVFNEDCRHERAREIGKLVYDKGGMGLMRKVHAGVRARLGNVQARELEHCWSEIGGWLD